MTLVPPLAASLLCLALAACSPEREASAVETAAPLSESCDRSGSMPEMKGCAQNDLTREQARMKRYLDAAMVRARGRDEGSIEYGPRSRQAAYLSESQKAWEAYAASRCAGVREETSGGTMGGLGYAWCMTTTTRQRTHDVWSDYLTYADTTPPVLPEPVQTIGEERSAAGLN